MDIDPYTDPLSPYGLDKEKVVLLGEEESFAGFLSKKLHIYKSQVVWAVREEMARTVEDVLARRTRALFLDARESLRIAPEVAEIMAIELGQDNNWITKQLKEFEEVAKNYYFD
jgi:glycerol-3-phosphate dehydrogenase